MTREVRAIGAVLTLALLAAAPATDTVRRSQIETDVTRLADRDSYVRDDALNDLKSLSASDLPLLRACLLAGQTRPGQADALRDVVVYVLTRDALRQMPVGGVPYIGVQHSPTRDLPTLDAKKEPLDRVGTTIVGVLPGSPAARELRAGDVIVGLDAPGRKPTWIVYNEQLSEWVSACPPGEAMTFVVRRAGRVMRISVVPEPRPLATNAGFNNEPMWYAAATSTLAENARMEANRVFDQEWATLPGMSP